jgi:hypothetical protein
MSQPAGVPHIVKAALKLSPVIELMIAQCVAIVLAMTGNAYFTAPNPLPSPSLVSIQNAIDTLTQLQAAARERTKGATTSRNLAKKALVKLMTLLCAYVQGIANSMPGEEANVILSAKMIVKIVSVRVPRVFSAIHGAVSGSAELEGPRVSDRKAMLWQWSMDQKIWNDVPPTLKASTTVSSLTPGTLYYFRFRALTKDGLDDWSEVVSLMMK